MSLKFICYSKNPNRIKILIKNEYFDEKIFKAFISICLILLILIFSIIAFNLFSLKNWANYEPICIEQENIDTSIPWAIRKCNWRSKVYQFNTSSLEEIVFKINSGKLKLIKEKSYI